MQFLKTPQQLLAGLVIGTVCLTAQAETKEDMSFGGLMEMKMIDKNKDGMVSKKEFLDMMAKAWDHKAKAMKAKDDKLSKADFEEVLKYLRAGG